MHAGFWLRNSKERGILQGLGVGGRVMLKKQNWWAQNGVCLAEDRDNWRAVVNTALNVWDHKIEGAEEWQRFSNSAI